MTMMIREATIQDYDALCNIFAEVDEQHRLALPDIFQKSPGPVRSLTHIKTLISEQTRLLLVAEMDENLVGLVEAEIRETPPIDFIISRQYVSIETIVVRSQARGQGLGKALLQAAEAWAIKQGVESIQLGVYAFNQQAINIYRHLGYKTIQIKMSKNL